MSRSLSHQNRIFDAIDRRCNAERERIEAERDLARELVSTWLASLSRDDQPQAATSKRSVMETSPAPILSDKKELTVKDLAAIWAVSTRSIYEWKTTGGLPCKKHGRLLRFDWAEADAWSKRHRESIGKARLRMVK